MYYTVLVVTIDSDITTQQGKMNIVFVLDSDGLEKIGGMIAMAVK